MLIHKNSGLVFANRKEAKKVLGQNRFKTLTKSGEIEYINDPEEQKRYSPIRVN